MCVRGGQRGLRRGEGGRLQSGREVKKIAQSVWVSEVRDRRVGGGGGRGAKCRGWGGVNYAGATNFTRLAKPVVRVNKID